MPGIVSGISGFALAHWLMTCCDGLMRDHLQPVQWQYVSPPAEGGATVFEIQVERRMGHGQHINLGEQGFIVCFQGELKAWHNTCPHAGSPLDWIPGQFFSEDGEQLVCHTHGARFHPVSGDCLAGPCEHGLYALPIRKTDAGIEVPLKMVSE